MGETLFISDLHLDSSRPEINRLFLSFLEARAAHADALYILGDFFEAWVGDDTLLSDDPIIKGLYTLTQSGVPGFFMRGNRDFLIGQRFATATGFVLLDDPTVIELEHQQILLMHGDTLCTDDLAYQKFRRMVRNPIWQWCFLRLPRGYRQRKANEARSRSQAYQKTASQHIMDVNPITVTNTMRAHQTHTLIHGHTHRPNIHHLDIDGAPAERIVLGDWYHQGSLLSYRDGEFTLETLNTR